MLGTRFLGLGTLIAAVGIASSLAKELAPFEYQVVSEALPYDVDKNRPVSVLLSRSVFPAEDGHLDAILWLNEKNEGAVEGKLKIIIFNASREAVSESVLESIPGKTLFIAPAFPKDLVGAEGTLVIRWLRPELPVAEVSTSFRIDKASAVPTSGEIAIRIPNESGLDDVIQPVTVGVPFPRGALWDPKALTLTNERGEKIPLQVEPVARWSRLGSIKWCRCSFSAELKGSPAGYRLHYGKNPEPEASAGIRVEGRKGFPSIETESLRVDDGLWRKADDGKWVKVLEQKALSGGFVEAEDGSIFIMNEEDDYKIESSGSENVTVLKTGWYKQAGGEKRFCKYVVRYVFDRRSPLLKIFYTWIFTGDSQQDRIRDMGWRFPSIAGLRETQFLQGSDQSGVSGDYLLQYDFDKSRVVKDGRVVHEGGRSPGVMTGSNDGGRITLGLHDFWQNFPSELEFASNEMVFHLWPKHADLPSHTVKIEDALRLWFAHEGRVLDFALPFEWAAKDEIYYSAPHAEGYTARGREASMNAQGIAKTTEFWLLVDGRERSIAQAGKWMSALESASVRAVVDPRWVAESGAFYEIQPQDWKQFPTEEAIFELHALAPAKWIDRIKFYGKWIHGDMTWEPDVRKEAFGFYRGFRKSHQGWPYSWIPYARSGDARILKMADAATRHLSDVVFCHYSDERVPAPGTTRARPLGFHTRFPIPWASHTARASSRGYTDKCNYLWDSYYLTGYDRARDVALDFGRATKYDGSNIWGGPFDDRMNFELPKDLKAPANWVRCTPTMLQTYTQMFEATFDPWYLAAMHQIAHQHLEYFNKTGWEGYYWNAGPREFLRFTGSPEYWTFFEAYTKKWTGPEGVFSAYTNDYPQMEAPAFAALHRDDPLYLRRVRGLVNEMIATTYDGKVDEFKGTRPGAPIASPMYTGYLLQYLPNALYALARQKEPVEPLYQKFFQCAPTGGKSTMDFPEIRLEKSSNESIPFRALFCNLPDHSLGNIKVSLTGPGDRERVNDTVAKIGGLSKDENSLDLRPARLSSSLPGQFISGFDGIEGRIPGQDASGVYSLHFGGDSFGPNPAKVKLQPAMYLPLSNQKCREVLRLDDRHRVGPAFPRSRYAFQIPAGADRLRFTVLRPVSSAAIIAIWNQQGERVAKFPVNDRVQQPSIICEFEVPRDAAGQVWELVVPHSHAGVQFDKTIVPWVATQRQLWFNPEQSKGANVAATLD